MATGTDGGCGEGSEGKAKRQSVRNGADDGVGGRRTGVDLRYASTGTGVVERGGERSTEAMVERRQAIKATKNGVG